jgi:hypothetical protein
MDFTKINEKIEVLLNIFKILNIFSYVKQDESPIESTRIRVARNILGYGLSPAISR